jgi:hypothetical protein
LHRYVEAGDVQLAHLPAGRFVYGHGFLKPFEFTSMWSTATGNRAGAPAQVGLRTANYPPVQSSHDKKVVVHAAPHNNALFSRYSRSDVYNPLTHYPSV